MYICIAKTHKLATSFTSLLQASESHKLIQTYYMIVTFQLEKFNKHIR